MSYLCRQPTVFDVRPRKYYLHREISPFPVLFHNNVIKCFQNKQKIMREARTLWNVVLNRTVIPSVITNLKGTA